ncbi:hypothetical protein VB264_21565 [Arcicella aquatica]|uniref:TY-Chap N-terminal domain-containing protein n=1 Tax=Arcicella aquatica TaxID=217141 RepID=A0ABU5QTR3_9BACT|nr:hypothetical protein [Arcicella aquatica]MEA5260403.1 hypothetical protein [Arcicella aquatica]
MNHSLIKTAIHKILKEGGDSNYFVIDITKDYYIQAASSKGAEDVFCEAVSNQYLSQASKLSADQLNKLKEIGWHQPTESNVNFFLELPADNNASIDFLTNFLASTIKEVYLSDNITKESFQFHLE